MNGTWSYIRSFILPQTLEKRASRLNPYLEVVYSKGKLKLNSRTINYSDNKTHEVFSKAFRKFSLGKRKPERILMLGFGTGSIAKLLNEKFKITCAITGVEADPTVIDIARKHFGLDAIKNLDLYCEDAFDFVLNCPHRFDVIVVDIFLDKYVPSKFHEQRFVDALVKLLSANGILFFNYVAVDDNTEAGLKKLFSRFDSLPGTAKQFAISITGIGNVVIVYENCK